MGKIYKPLMVFVFILCSWIQVQAQTVSGIVQDDQGQPLPGATIQIEALKKVTTSDVNGNFQFTNIPAGDYSLKISFIGFKPIIQSIKVEQGKNLVIPKLKMKMDAQQLDDVVVVGYGTQQKREVTGSISRIPSKEITSMPTQSVEGALQGRASGVQVIQSSGVAGAGALVRVRGLASVSASGDPLYVVDGIPITQDPFLGGERGAMNNNPLATLNPNDIESIEILKDAAAAGIYGSRGANGVILITTKRGKSKKPVFEFSTRIGNSRPTNMLEMLNADEWLQLRQEAWENDGNVGRATLPNNMTWEEAQKNNTDWIKETIKPGWQQEYNFSAQQKFEKLAYYAGLSYSDKESFLIGNKFKRISGRINVDYQPIKNLKLIGSSSLSRGFNQRVPLAWDGGFGMALSTALPIYPVKNPDGTYYREGNMYNNPVAWREYVDWTNIELRSINNGQIVYTPFKNFEINASGSIDFMSMNESKKEDSEWDRDGAPGNKVNRQSLWKTNVRNWNTFLTASYKLDLNEKNKFRFMLGTEAQKSSTFQVDSFATGRDGHIDQYPTFSKFDFKNKTPQIFSFLSAFGRVNYDLNNKFFTTLNLRTDGSSRFGSNNRFGFFPSAGFGYVLSEENFMKNIKVINYLRLKTSIGLTGNAGIPNYQRWGTYSLTTSGNNSNYNGNPILYPTRLENPNLKWEKARVFDLGFEIGFLEDRITADFSYFNKLSTDVLVNTAIQTSAGFDRYFQNIGSVSNKGVEFSITSRNLVGKLKWTTNFNITHLKQEVLDIGDGTPDAISGSGDTRVLVGYPLGVNFLTRLSRVDSETGLPVFLDKNGNETYEWTEANRVPVGDVIPDFTGGITNTFEYKGFDFSFMFVFTIGGNLYDDARKRQMGIMTDWNYTTEILDGRWTTPGQNAEYPKLTLKPQTYGNMGSEWFYNTDQWLFDATYLRLRSVTFGYTFKSEILEKVKLKTARIYFVGTNLLTFSNYPGLDPEVVRDFNGPQARNLSPNVTYLTPPQEKTFNIGLSLTF